MTITDRNIIDFMGMSKTDGRLILTISDHLLWSDYQHHSMALQDKITDYLEYIYSTRQKGNATQTVEIQLMMKYMPDEQGLAFLERIKEELDRLGFEFTYRVFDPESW